MDDFTKKIEDELEKQKAELLKPNIAIVGGTGVGKSSLVNRFFGIEVASVDAGNPVTKGMDKYEQEDIPVVIYDTEGYEITSSSNEGNNFDANIKPKIEEMNSKELKSQIHLVWYCISITNHRVTNYDLQNIEYFVNNGMKTSVVFTKCDCDEELKDGSGKEASEFKKIIKDQFPNIEFFETSSNKDLTLDLDKLNGWSSESLSDDRLKASFISAQKVSIEMKKQEARKYVNSITTSVALSTALTNIVTSLTKHKISDSFVIAPQQLEMCVKISTVFGFDSFGENTKSILQEQLVTLSSKKLVVIIADKVKDIPKYGKLLACIINTTVALAMTFALGMAIVEVYAKAYKDYLENEELPNWMELFSSEMFLNYFVDVLETYNKGTDSGK